MRGTYIETDTVSLKRDTDALVEQMNAAAQCLEGIVNEVELLSASWKGNANAMFQKQVMEDAEFLSEILKEVSDLAGCMGFAQKEYINCENDVSDAIAAVRI